MRAVCAAWREATGTMRRALSGGVVPGTVRRLRSGDGRRQGGQARLSARAVVIAEAMAASCRCTESRTSQDAS